MGTQDVDVSWHNPELVCPKCDSPMEIAQIYFSSLEKIMLEVMCESCSLNFQIILTFEEIKQRCKDKNLDDWLEKLWELEDKRK